MKPPVPILALAALAGLGCTKKTATPPPRPSDGASPAVANAAHDAGRDALLAASFDCKKAGTKIERMICASPELQNLDGELAVAFKQAQGRYLDVSVLKSAQHDWLVETRNRATDEEALSGAYATRLEELRTDIEAGREVVNGELAWRMMVSPNGFDQPVITRWRNARAKKEINAALAKVASDMGCTAEPEEGSDPFTFVATVTVTYTEHDIFSVQFHDEYWCGGGRKDETYGRTFDLRTGAEIGFQELFTDNEKDRRALLELLFGAALEKSENRDRELESLVSYDLVNFLFGDDGLHVWRYSSTPDEIIVPYAKLKRWAAPKGLLARIKN